MLNRKSCLVLAAAAFAAVPAVTKAAPVISFSYDQNEFLYSPTADPTFSDAVAATFDPVTNTVTIPQGSLLEIGVDATVTGNNNAAATGSTGAATYNAGTGTKKNSQPATLGLSAWGFGFTDDKKATAAIITGNGNAATASSAQAAGDTAYNIFGPGNLDGNGGITTGGPLSGGVSGGNGGGSVAGQSIAKSQFGIGSTNPELFNNLFISGLQGGTAHFTPSAPIGVQYFTYVSGGTNSTTPPTYAANGVNEVLGANADGTAVTGLAMLTVVVTPSASTSHSVISLTASGGGVVSGYGVKITSGSGDNQGAFNPPSAQNNLTVAGGGGGYSVAQVTGINSGAGDVADSVEGNGFVPAGDTEIYALDVLGLSGVNTPATLAAAINADPNAQAGTGMTASATYPGAGINPFPGIYNLFLSFTTPPSGDNFLGFDLSNSNDASIPSGLTVAAVALVPEPCTAAVMLFGASGLLLGRRKRKA